MTNTAYIISIKKFPEVTIALLMLFSISCIAQNHTIGSIRAKCFQEYGGRDKLQSLMSITSTGYTVNADGDTTYFTSIKTKSRADTNIIQTKNEKYIFYSDSTNRFVLAKRFGEKPVRIGKNLTRETFEENPNFSIHPFLDINKKDTNFIVASDTTLNGNLCFCILYNTADYIATIYIQQKNFHIVADSLVRHSDDRIQIETVYSNFKIIKGVLFPHTISSNTTNKYSGSVTSTIQKISIVFSK